MRFIDAAGIDARLTFPVLVDALRLAFKGDTTAPHRHHHVVQRPDEDAMLLLMPAWTGGGAARIGVKIVTVFPANGARGLPAVAGTYLLMDGETGLPQVALDGTRLTLWRTAAVSALASSYLSRPDARTLAMVGAGALAPFLIRAHMSVRPIERVLLWNHRGERAQEVAAELAAEGLPVSAAASLEEAVAQADIVSAATLSKTALVKGAWLKPGVHLDLVGAFNMSMRESDDEALRRSAIFIDTAAAMTEGGDVAIAIANGVLAGTDIRADLHDLTRDRHPGRRSEQEITLFKAVGTALADLATAAEAAG